MGFARTEPTAESASLRFPAKSGAVQDKLTTARTDVGREEREKREPLDPQWPRTGVS